MLHLALHMRFHIHLFGHHHFRGPPFDYGALALAAAASWVGVPGPGEPILVAAGIFAARHQLDLATVVGVAWLAANIGGITGWIVGRQAGRTVLTAPGPMHRLRLKAVKRGDEVFERVPVLAIVLAPTWIAGIHGVKARLFLPVNAVSATLWAVGIGVGAYLAGPAVLDVVADLGWVLGGALVVVVAGALGFGILQRRRGREQRAV